MQIYTFLFIYTRQGHTFSPPRPLFVAAVPPFVTQTLQSSTHITTTPIFAESTRKNSCEQ